MKKVFKKVVEAAKKVKGKHVAYGALGAAAVGLHAYGVKEGLKADKKSSGKKKVAKALLLGGGYKSYQDIRNDGGSRLRASIGLPVSKKNKAKGKSK